MIYSGRVWDEPDSYWVQQPSSRFPHHHHYPAASPEETLKDTAICSSREIDETVVTLRFLATVRTYNVDRRGQAAAEPPSSVLERWVTANYKHVEDVWNVLSFMIFGLLPHQCPVNTESLWSDKSNLFSQTFNDRCWNTSVKFKASSLHHCV